MKIEKPLEGYDNWEARFNALFYANRKKANLKNQSEGWAYLAIEWLKKYSPLNKYYGIKRH